MKNKKEMGLIAIDDGLNAYSCVESGGIFLPIQNYTTWLSKRDGVLPKLSTQEVAVEAIDEDGGAKICPESGHIMSRFKVGHNFPFYLDRSPMGSIWLDKGEWEQLKERNYHDELISIFSVSWQNKIVKEHQDKAKNTLLEKKLGTELYKELKELREKLQTHSNLSLALAFLGKQD